MTRDEAESAYVEKVMAQGNPAYFIYLALRDLTNEDLIDIMSAIQIDIDEIEEEE